MLEIKDLHVTVDGKEILKGLDLAVNKGEVHAIMGPNGSGKSTLAYVMAGKAGYEATEGEVLLDGENLLGMEPDERAAKGLFLAFQYPLEIPGVATVQSRVWSVPPPMGRTAQAASGTHIQPASAKGTRADQLDSPNT